LSLSPFLSFSNSKKTKLSWVLTDISWGNKNITALGIQGFGSHSCHLIFLQGIIDLFLPIYLNVGFFISKIRILDPGAVITLISGPSTSK
jgi:hypothetical protein